MLSTLLMLLGAVAPMATGQMNDDGKSWRPPDPGINNIWFAKNPSSDTVFVFIHGIRSDSRCWLYEENGHPKQYWPYLVWQDERLHHPSVFLSGYAFGPHYNIFDAVQEVLKSLINQKVMDYPNIVFVAHSMGGVVLRRMLCSYVPEFQKKKVGLLFASPSSGSGIADIASELSFLLPGKVSQNPGSDRLKSDSPYLVELDQEFKTLTNGHRLTIVGEEAVEGDGTLGQARIVDRNSAARYFDYRTLPGDHSSIVKPTTITSPSHEFVVEFYTRFGSFFKSDPFASISMQPVTLPPPISPIAILSKPGIIEVPQATTPKEESVKPVLRPAPQLPPEQPKIPSQGVLRCSGAPVPKNGRVVFDNLPPQQLRFVWDHLAWQGWIKKQANGNKQLILVSLKPGYQTSCEVRWEVVAQ